MQTFTLPRYVKIALDLSRRVLNEEIKVGDLLKGRSILAAEYKVSSETIRKAVAMMEKEEIVEVRKGVGVFVSDVIKAELFVNKYKADRSVRQQEREIMTLLAARADLDAKIQSSYNEILDSFKFRTTEQIAFYEVEVLEGSKAVGKTIGQLMFWKSTGATIVAIVHDDAITVSPGPDAMLYVGDFIIVVGDNEVVARVERFLDEGISAEDMAKNA